MWITKDYKGNSITYYSEEEYKALEEELAKYKERMYNIYKACDDETINIKHFFIGVLKAMGILDDFFIRREKEKDDMRGM